MNDIIKIAIVDEDNKSAEAIKKYCEQYLTEINRAFVINIFMNVVDFVSDYKPVYDLILMETEFSHMDGITAAKKLREIDSGVMLVFVTGNNSYAVNGYSVDAFDYILKPINFKNFMPKLMRAFSRIISMDSERIISNNGDSLRVLYVRDICYVECCGHDVMIHTADETITMRGRLYDVEENLKAHGFFRIYNCYIVNLRYVTKIKDNILTVNGKELTISRSKRKGLIEALKFVSVSLI